MEKQEFFANLQYLPIAVFISLPTVFISTYVIAVLLGHVEAGFPYISDTATYAPESSIFSQAVNLITILMGFAIYIRYSQVKECISSESPTDSLLAKWNYWALIFGLMSTAGLSIVANFQETSVIVVHLIGAFLCFGGGTAYFWTQAVCSFCLYPSGCSLRIAQFRTALSTFCTVCFIVIVITGVLAHSAYKGTNPRKWHKEDGGWELHVVSTITEWLCAIAFCTYILTFTEEFRDIRIIPPKVICNMHRLSRGAGYVNLLSPLPVDTPCPGYRYRESRDNLLDEAAPLVATTPPALHDNAERNSDVLCPVEIHVHDPTIRERRRRSINHHTEKRHQRTDVEHSSKRWIDLDENVLDGYILIDDRNLGPSVPEHGNAYQDSSSHSKYAELYSRHQSARNNLEMARGLDTSSYTVANSHGEHGNPAADIRDRDYRESSKNDNLALDTSTDMNYEIANSHSNYRVFYDSQTQHQAMMPPWSSELWSENRRKESHVMQEGSKVNITKKQDNEKYEASTNQSEKKDEPDSETTCDIEQCLVQIEESLLNIEQNLLHVQDLDIPELRNLLYKSPSIERSLYEVQDLLYADGIVPVIPRNKSISLDSDEEEENEEEEIEEEVWVGQNTTIKDNDNEDGNAGAPVVNNSNEECSDINNVDQHNPSKSDDDHCTDKSNVLIEEEKDSNSQIYSKKNFILNSLGKTLPRKIALDEVKENIRLCSSEPEEPATTIDYNLNSAYVEKKSLFRDKWHSRASSLDENSIFQNSELGDKQENEPSLQDVFLMATGSRRLAINAKALSEGTLQTNKKKQHDRRGSHEEKLLQAVEATAADFRKKLESFASQRRSILHKQKRMTPKLAKEVSDNVTSRSKEKSPTKPKRAIATTAKIQDKDNGADKNTSCDKRKRKKISGKNQGASENALVPSKLISLSLSLLLAALLQAVRCLTDLVEDAFRSVSYDRSGLLQ
ncbi:DNA damage-regulated autophagy modulator protein 2 [Trachymyrmex septentrionalis]|uniref:DNA damage-regulated autophagy modulator protein 2 n=1 Tax=Trachymyrmex septentrionalis TaxID=34720 RepID=A0A195FID1_9HYME|nr:DNA damage-regulated autophagy modulator protein 2 [Trachymyrmex septentrionalis]